MASVERIAQKIEKGEGTIGKLVNDDTTVTKMNETMDNLNETMGLYRKIQLNVRYRGEYLTGAERFQHQIGMSIWPAPDKFLMFEIVDAPAGRTRVVSTSVFQNGTVVSATKTVQTGDELLFTFLLGKRFWDLTLRFGLMRSTGGLGVDYSLFHDKFVVSFEAFDFARNEDRFHMRVFGTIVLYKHLILTGGVDDALTKLGSKNPFFGAGLQFNDEDFKSLVTLAPKAL
jgi:phospholipid/cholesterol/gamma-HCH transport system substrate-binding protein